MIRIITFTNDNNKLFDFNFNDPTITYYPEIGWTNITATKQTITICGNSFLGYDKDLIPANIDSSFFSLGKDWIEEFYAQGDKILIISSLSDEPLFIFHGAAISISNKKNDYAEFTIDGKKIYINNLHWIIISRNA